MIISQAKKAWLILIVITIVSINAVFRNSIGSPWDYQGNTTIKILLESYKKLRENILEYVNEYINKTCIIAKKSNQTNLTNIIAELNYTDNLVNKALALSKYGNISGAVKILVTAINRAGNILLNLEKTIKLGDYYNQTCIEAPKLKNESVYEYEEHYYELLGKIERLKDKAMTMLNLSIKYNNKYAASLLNKSLNLLSQAQNILENDYKLAEKLVDQAEDQIENAEELIEKLVKSELKIPKIKYKILHKINELLIELQKLQAYNLSSSIQNETAILKEMLNALKNELNNATTLEQIYAIWNKLYQISHRISNLEDLLEHQYEEDHEDELEEEFEDFEEELEEYDKLNASEKIYHEILEEIKELSEKIIKIENKLNKIINESTYNTSAFNSTTLILELEKYKSQLKELNETIIQSKQNLNITEIQSQLNVIKQGIKQIKNTLEHISEDCEESCSTDTSTPKSQDNSEDNDSEENGGQSSEEYEEEDEEESEEFIATLIIIK